MIADTFADRLARLTGEEQKAVKTAAFDMQLNPTNLGLGFHKLARTLEYPWDKWTIFPHDEALMPFLNARKG
ncbi:hypothetical protein [uncultured Thiodictyon sp.]|uniref:hypothetical protein n=1 Tax=uncultured Thiodictyon sp. TaxID=1846217 RepID=UPI0025CD97D3|nr:hypothetical protein [uncultured Thiodictyon sp.]